MAGAYCDNPIPCTCTEYPVSGDCPKCHGTKVMPCGTRIAFAPPARVFCPRCSNSKALKRAGVPRQGKGVQDPLDAYAHRKPPDFVNCGLCYGSGTKGGDPCGGCGGKGKVPYQMPSGAQVLPPAIVEAARAKGAGLGTAAAEAAEAAVSPPSPPPATPPPPTGKHGHKYTTVKR